MGEKEETEKGGKDDRALFPPTKKKKGSFFSRLFHKKQEKPAEQLLQDVPSGKKFILTTGKKIKNIPQMIGELKNISDTVFKAHINEEKNDVANWIRDVFKDNDLADKIMKTKRKNKIIRLLEKEMKKTEKEFKDMKERLQKEELEKTPIPPTPPESKLNKIIKPPKSPNRLEVNIKNPSKKIWETIAPPPPPKGFFKKRRMPSKTKAQHEELDKLITLKEEKSRIDKKRSMLSSKEKSLEAKNRKLHEHEKSHKRALENIENIKKAADHDVRERLVHVRGKQKELQDLRSKVSQERKKIEEKDELLDKLRKKYLDTIAKEKSLEEKETTLKNREEDLKKTKTELQKIKADLDEKFKSLKSEAPNLTSKWESNFTTFNNLKHQLEIKEREMKPVLLRFDDDIQLLTKKESNLISKIKRLEKDEKLLSKKEDEVITKVNKLMKEEKKVKKDFTELKKKESEIAKLEKQLKKDSEKVKRVKEMKENLNRLRTEINSVENQLKKKSDILLNIPKREQELDNIEEELLREKLEIDRRDYKINSSRSEFKQEKEKQEQEMEEKFHSYLQKSLAKPGLEQITKEKPREYTHNEVYVLIDSCRSLIGSKETDEAKLLYNKIRKTFMNLDLKGTERDMLKDTIKELYQQINISAIAQ